ncbi:MAG TPA: DUF2937 family protein [Nevskia sp.]|nr:DUF2937 family protein [Nevskia sp.]
MSFLYRYLLILIACVALLMGIQIPSFVDQYEKRLDAHLQEVQADLKGYQDIANRDFGGSMEALIRRHKESTDMVFRDEAGPIETIYLRFLHFKEQREGLKTQLPGKVTYLLRYGDHDLLRETYASYSYTVPLDSEAIYAGFALVAIALLLAEFVLGLLGLLGGMRRSPRALRF